jgi:hypothetical protein
VRSIGTVPRQSHSIRGEVDFAIARVVNLNVFVIAAATAAALVVFADDQGIFYVPANK